MKNFLTSLFAFVFAISANSQVVSITSIERSMSTGSHTALSAHVHGVQYDDAMKDFVSFWKDRGARTEYKDGEMKALNFEVKELKPTIFTLYAAAHEEDKNDCIVYLWVYNGVEFIAPQNPDYGYFEKALKEFAVAENKKPYEKELKESNKALDKLSNEKKSLEQKRINWQRDIDDCNKTITETQGKLKDSESMLSDFGKKIKQQELDSDKLKQRINSIQ